MNIENPEFGRSNPSEKEQTWKQNIREDVFEQIIYYYQLKIPYNYFDLLENVIEFRKNFEHFLSAKNKLSKKPDDEQLKKEYEEATDKISRLLLLESAIELSYEYTELLVSAGSALYGEIQYTATHLIPTMYQNTIFILED
jgi:predicted nuclease with TOPRIM domain